MRAVVQVIAVVLVLGLVLLVLKWALITAAILVVPFGIWWVADRYSARRRTGRAQADEAFSRRRAAARR